MAVGDFCSRDVVITHPGSPVHEAARLMREHHVGDLIVVEGGEGAKPIGVVTDRDLVIEVMAKEVPPEAVTVGDIMTSDLLTVRECDGLWDTLRRMRAHGVRRVPVVDAGGERLVGIISADDVLDLLSEELAAVARISSSERERESRQRP